MVVCSNPVFFRHWLQYSAVPRGLEPLEGVTPGVVGSATTGSPVKGTHSSLRKESISHFLYMYNVHVHTLLTDQEKSGFSKELAFTRA